MNGPFNRFQRDRSGMVLLVFALLLIPLVGIVGLAVDAARGYAVRSQLQQALDSAALAGGRVFGLTDAQRDAVIRAFFAENLRKSRYGAIINVLDPKKLDISADTAAGTLTVGANATMPVSLMKVLGFTTVPVVSAAQITRKNSKLELALALDVSNSMNDKIGCAYCTTTKIASLRSAAKLLVDIVYRGATGDTVQVSVIPWNERVFVDPTYSGAWCSPSPSSSWKGNVSMRWTSDLDLSDVPPSVAPFQPLLSASYIIPTLLPLTATPGTVKSYISKLTANGNTTSTVGLFWGWMTLSPKWRGLWADVPGTLPRDYTDHDNIKALVMMTDGVDNTVSSSYSPMPVARNDRTFPARNWLKARSIATCAKMKALGIRIYTIGFGPEPLSDPSAIDLLKSCATGGNFFPAANGTELAAAFQAIASDLSALRLSR